MKWIVAAVIASPVSAFVPSTPAFSRCKTSVPAYDLDYGKNNGYETAPGGDGGQGEFGAVSPNNWRVAGTSPVGETSWAGAAVGGDEPWFAEAVSTVFMDIKQGDDIMAAYTAKAADFKIKEFAAGKPYGFSTEAEAKDELISAMGYGKFLEVPPKMLLKEWAKLHPEPKPEPKEPTEEKPKAEKKPAAKKE